MPCTCPRRIALSREDPLRALESAGVYLTPILFTSSARATRFQKFRSAMRSAIEDPLFLDFLSYVQYKLLPPGSLPGVPDEVRAGVDGIVDRFSRANFMRSCTVRWGAEGELPDLVLALEEPATLSAASGLAASDGWPFHTFLDATVAACLKRMGFQVCSARPPRPDLARRGAASAILNFSIEPRPPAPALR
eukprot:tig00001085_g6961.t2